MNRPLLVKHLASARRHVEEGQDLVRSQRDRIYDLGKAGHDTSLAELVMARLQASQAMRIAESERLENLLANLGS
jgi:hypothetical protein